MDATRSRVRTPVDSPNSGQSPDSSSLDDTVFAPCSVPVSPAQVAAFRAAQLELLAYSAHKLAVRQIARGAGGWLCTDCRRVQTSRSFLDHTRDCRVGAVLHRVSLLRHVAEQQGATPVLPATYDERSTPGELSEAGNGVCASAPLNPNRLLPQCVETAHRVCDEHGVKGVA